MPHFIMLHGQKANVTYIHFQVGYVTWRHIWNICRQRTASGGKWRM